MHNNFFNILRKFTRQVKEGRESFTQKRTSTVQDL